MEKQKRTLSRERQDALLTLLKNRFEDNMARHPDLDWLPVRERLEQMPDKLWSLDQMEQTGGEPDVICRDNETGEYIFHDCSSESPAGRRSLCYDPDALASRKDNKPRASAIGLASEMGVELLTEDVYRAQQSLGVFDTKTSSWVKTPDSIRKLGGALFCDRRYDTVFTYHNGAESYYASRGFRSSLRV